MAEGDPVRLDKWLWAARFFKTRSLATDAVRGGHVHVDGQRAKPSRGVRVGERLAVSKGDIRFEVMVRTLSENRGPAPVAETLYEETEVSRQARESQRARRREARLSPPPAPDGRPDKKQRRQLRRMRGR